MNTIRFNDTEVAIPEEYKQVQSLPDDPKNSLSYGASTDKALLFVMFAPLKAEKAMPFEHPQVITEAVEQYLMPNQGLLKVENGTTAAERKYVYTIVKTADETAGVQYTLTMQLIVDDSILSIQGFFDEDVEFGVRQGEGLEDEKMDVQFLGHPLSKLREFIKFVVENN